MLEWKQKNSIARIGILCIFCIALFLQPVFAKPQPSSVSAANYYELKPNDATCGPAAVMSLMNWYKLLGDKDLTAQPEMRIAGEMGTGDMKSPLPGTTTEQMDHSNWCEDI